MAGPSVPVGTALLGTVLAVTALSATTVFGASLAWLIKSPALYGVPYNVNFSNAGTGLMPSYRPAGHTLERDPAIDQITLAAAADERQRPSRAGGRGPAFHGAPLISAVDGRLPRGDQDIVLGAATLRGLGAGARPGPDHRGRPSDRSRPTTRFRGHRPRLVRA